MHLGVSIASYMGYNMKTYNFSQNPIIQEALRHYANFGEIPNFDGLMDELEKLLAELKQLRDFKDSVEINS